MTAVQLIAELGKTLDPALASAAVTSYAEMQRRFVAGDWKPAELDGGRLCEAVARCLLQADTGVISHTKLPGEIIDRLTDNAASRAHLLHHKDRAHMCKVMATVYKFRSDRGAVHISPIHSANYMDAMLIVHAGKWMLAELLRLVWNSDRKLVGQVIEGIVQLEVSLIHELDGRPLVLVPGISAPDEVLLLLSHAPGNRLLRADLRSQATRQKPKTLAAAVSRLIEQKLVRVAGEGELALTPTGQKRLTEGVVPKYVQA